MKSIHQLLTTVFIAGLLVSCSPRVITQIIQTRPPLPADQEVRVYNRENNDSVPASAQTLGNVAVVDRGSSSAKNGTFEKVVQLASDATRQNGGNALLITDHIKPSFWRSTIHQIGGVMLWVNPDDTVAVSSQKYVSLTENIQRRRGEIPVHTFLLNTGFGSVTARTPGLSGEAAQFENALSNGITFELEYNFQPKNKMFGVGVIATQYHSAPFGRALFNKMEHRVQIDYLGISLLRKDVLAKKWFFNASVGYGYLRYRHFANMLGNYNFRGKATGGTMGMYSKIGVEYKMSKRWGLSIDLSTTLGSFSSLDYDNLIVDESARVSDKNRLNASRINSTVGVRFYL